LQTAAEHGELKGVKNFQIIFRDGRSRYLAADRYIPAGDTIIFYSQGKIVAAISRADLTQVKEVALPGAVA
jgi:hypothetical protein